MPTITDVRCFEVEGTFTSPEIPPGNRQITAGDIYGPPDLVESDPRHSVDGKPRPVKAIYVEVVTKEATGIFGPIERFQVPIILNTLRRVLVRHDALATERVYDKMIREDRHGRSGYFMTAVSAVDCALWDLKAKLFGVPVYRLLGGPTRRQLPAYASMLGHSINPEQAAATAVAYQDMGYTAQKWFFRYGPSHGAAGVAANVALVRALRDAVGETYPLMFDAFMGWNVTYASEIARRIAPYHPAWLEEPIPPERVGGFVKIKQAASIPLATGEHVYTRWQVRELLTAGAVDTVQTDPDWCGGITELRKIIALCSAFEVPHVAHGHSLLPALHVAAAESPAAVPLIEYLVLHQRAKQWFHTEMHEPEAGMLGLPDTPGLGITIDDSKVAVRRDL